MSVLEIAITDSNVGIFCPEPVGRIKDDLFQEQAELLSCKLVVCAWTGPSYF